MNKFSPTTLTFYPEVLLGRYPSVPYDAVDVTTPVMKQFQAAPPAGKHLGSDETGQPIWVDDTQPSVSERRTNAKTAIDTAAGKVREAYVSTGQLIEEEYRLVQLQTEQWRAAGSPADNVPPAISGWATAAGLTNEQAATGIETAAVQLEGLLITVRNIRLTGKNAVDIAADSVDFEALQQLYVDQLNALMP